jgi:signal transduction histidine kinase
MFYEMATSALKAKDAVPFIFLSGCFVLCVSVICDILSVEHIIIAPYVFHFGLTGFIIAQMVIIALINSQARASAEFLSREMRTNNENLLHEIQHRTTAEVKIKEQYDIIQRKNEELEAMNEELEAINEEFESVNRELKQTHHDLLRSNENLEREKERLAVTLRSIADGVIATDTGGTITVANETAESLLETSDYGLIGSSIDEIVKIFREEGGDEIENPSIAAMREGDEVEIDRGYRLLVAGGTC